MIIETKKKMISFSSVGDVKKEGIRMRKNNSDKPKEDNNENNDFFPSNNDFFGSFPQGSYSDPINSKNQNDGKMDLSQLNNLKWPFSKDSFSKAINNLYGLFKKQNLCVKDVIFYLFVFGIFCCAIYLLWPKNWKNDI